MPLTVFNSLTPTQKKDAIKGLIEESTPRQDFFLLMVLAVVMASLGLLLDNITIIIGSMLIAPILYPVLTLGLGVVMSDTALIGRSLTTILKSLVLAVGMSAIIGFVFLSPDRVLTQQIVDLTQPSLTFAVVAFVAGVAAAFASAKPWLNEAFPGVAISVALLPPLAVSGIGIAMGSGEIARNALFVFITNSAGIMFAALIVYSLMRLYGSRHVAKHAVKQEDKKVKAEEKKAAAVSKR